MKEQIVMGGFVVLPALMIYGFVRLGLYYRRLTPYYKQDKIVRIGNMIIEKPRMRFVMSKRDEDLFTEGGVPIFHEMRRFWLKIQTVWVVIFALMWLVGTGL